MDNPTNTLVKKMVNRKKLVPILAIIIIVSITIVIFWQFFQSDDTLATPFSIRDDFDRIVEIQNYPPERIVSLSPSCTEILYALDLGSKIVGVDEYSDFPVEVTERVESGNLKTVGSFSEISIEAVIGLEPDLILATGGVQRLVGESLESRGYPVLILYPEKFDGVIEDITLVGKATGKTDEAKTLVDDMREQAQEIADKTADLPRPRVYVEYSQMGGYWTFGSEAFASELIYKAGGVNVFAGFAGAYMSTSTQII